MDVTDWRSVSQHYVREVVARAVQAQSQGRFRPTLLVAASDDALAVARVLRDTYRAGGSTAVPILTPTLQLVDDASNPLFEHVKPWGGTFSGAHILVVDKVDNSRATLAKFISELQAVIDGQKAAAAAGESADWAEPQVGVFVLHNKRKPKAADLPPEVLDGRYFVGEESDNVCIAYPFNLHDAQPTAHGEHASGAHPALHRRSLEHPAAVTRVPTPPPGTGPARDILRSLSSHYVETILEAAVEKQHLVERFGPTMIVAASDGALPAARLLRQYLRYRASRVPAANGTANGYVNGHVNGDQANGGAALPVDLPVLTPRLELHDEDHNPYLAHISGAQMWGPASLAGHHVLIVDRADDTRVSLAAFIAGLNERVAAARDAAGTAAWAGDPLLGVFVLHRKNVAKAADLPADILAERYFYGEDADNVQLAYPFGNNGR